MMKYLELVDAWSVDPSEFDSTRRNSYTGLTHNPYFTLAKKRDVSIRTGVWHVYLFAGYNSLNRPLRPHDFQSRSSFSGIPQGLIVLRGGRQTHRIVQSYFEKISQSEGEILTLHLEVIENSENPDT